MAGRQGLLAEAEIGQVDVVRAVAGVEQEVARLDVAVDQAARMGGVQRGGHLGDDAHRTRHWQRAGLVDERPDVASLDVAHRDEQDAGRLAGPEDRDDVRVVDRRRGPRLPDEPLPETLVAGQVGGQDLERDRTVQPRVLSTVDDRHPAPADLLVEAIARDLRANGEFVGCPRGFVVAQHASSACPPASVRWRFSRDSVRRTVRWGAVAAARTSPGITGLIHACGAAVSPQARRPEALHGSVYVGLNGSTLIR